MRAKKRTKASPRTPPARRARRRPPAPGHGARDGRDARADRARKVRWPRTLGLINAPLLRKWNEKKRTEDTLKRSKQPFRRPRGRGVHPAVRRRRGPTPSGAPESPGADIFDDEQLRRRRARFFPRRRLRYPVRGVRGGAEAR